MYDWPGKTSCQKWMTKTIPASIHTNPTSKSAILSNNYASLLIDLCACVQVKKIDHKWSHILLQWLIWNTSWDFKDVKKQWAGALLRENTAVVHEKYRERVALFWTKKKNIVAIQDFIFQYFCKAFSHLLVCCVVKTLKDEWYIVIKA